MKEYDGPAQYRPANMDRWDWYDMISEMRGDCEPWEHIESGTDEDGNDYYRRYHKVDSDMEDC